MTKFKSNSNYSFGLIQKYADGNPITTATRNAVLNATSTQVNRAPAALPALSASAAKTGSKGKSKGKSTSAPALARVQPTANEDWMKFQAWYNGYSGVPGQAKVTLKGKNNGVDGVYGNTTDQAWKLILGNADAKKAWEEYKANGYTNNPTLETYRKNNGYKDLSTITKEKARGFEDLFADEARMGYRSIGTNQGVARHNYFLNKKAGDKASALDMARLLAVSLFGGDMDPNDELSMFLAYRRAGMSRHLARKFARNAEALDKLAQAKKKAGEMVTTKEYTDAEAANQKIDLQWNAKYGKADSSIGLDYLKAPLNLNVNAGVNKDANLTVGALNALSAPPPPAGPTNGQLPPPLGPTGDFNPGLQLPQGLQLLMQQGLQQQLQLQNPLLGQQGLALILNKKTNMGSTALRYGGRIRRIKWYI